MPLKAFTSLALLALPASALASATPRAPARGWNVDFSAAQCVATRDYGTSREPVQLILKAPAFGDVVQVAIARKSNLTGPNQTEANVSVDGGSPFRVSMLAFTPRGTGYRIYSMNFPSSQFALVRQAHELSVRSDGVDERFALSDMAPLWKIVEDCVADLRRVFNVTDFANAESSPLKARARANLASLFSDDDYPAVAQERSQGGKVKFALLVGEDGRVADCTVIGTSGVATLDAQACALLRVRARFQPAVGADGRPAKDAVMGVITWRIP